MEGAVSKSHLDKFLSRRVLIAGGLGGLVAVLAARSLFFKAKIEKLATDPSGEDFVYRDGYIVKR